MEMWLFWIVAALLLFAAEAVTLSLFCAAVGLAALAAAALSFRAPPVAQVVVFSVLALVLILIVRPVVLRVLPVMHPDEQEDEDVLPGRHAVVVQQVSRTTGEIRLGQGEFWTARLAEGSGSIEPGREVEVVRVDGFTAYVEAVEEERPAPPLPAASSPVTPPAVGGASFGLSPREVEVLDLMALGLSNDEIAQRLFLSPRTVHHHVSHILTKMDADNRVEAVRKGIDAGLVSRNDTAGPRQV
jgi:membrane protein implicated in regulation of membrane protease activity/DNA-binding CsgD family transcriptional regulator